MRIKWTTLYVDDQAKALHFYTDKLGFQKKSDFSQGNYRWLTVTSPEDPRAWSWCWSRTPTPPAKPTYRWETARRAGAGPRAPACSWGLSYFFWRACRPRRRAPT